MTMKLAIENSASGQYTNVKYLVPFTANFIIVSILVLPTYYFLVLLTNLLDLWKEFLTSSD